MKKILLVPASVVCSFLAYSQAPVSNQVTKTQPAATANETFEQYCLGNALQVIATTKTDVQTAGEITLSNNPKATYRDYGITLKENEAQYFKIAGSDKLLKAESLYRLRLTYSNK